MIRKCNKKQKTKHGHYVGDRPSPEYYTWRSIKARCFNTKHHNYSRYGGSGVTMDPIWASDFSAFLKDVGLRPSMAHTIDRIKNTMGYIPGNVRWATNSVQNRNRSDNRWITVNNETLCLEDWAKTLGCSPAAIRARVKRGWTWELAVTVPPNKKFQTNNLLPAKKSNRPIAFGRDEITIVINQSGATKIFIGRRPIVNLKNIKINVDDFHSEIKCILTEKNDESSATQLETNVTKRFLMPFEVEFER